MALKRIGLLGGSFDPVHRAHITLAEAACRALTLDEVQLIPAGDPWQRPTLGATPGQRRAMLELAVKGRGCLSVNPIELNRPGKTYTAETLEQLPKDAHYFWILGGDQLINFCTWHRWKDVATIVQLVVALRPGSSAEPPAELARLLEQLHRQIIQLPVEPMDVSSSEIRRRLALGESTADLLDPAVENYIHNNQLYASPNTGRAEV